MTDEPASPGVGHEPTETVDTGPAGRPAPVCPTDKVAMIFESGRQVHDLWSEHYLCERCGRETFRSYGRGSV